MEWQYIVDYPIYKISDAGLVYNEEKQRFVKSFKINGLNVVTLYDSEHYGRNFQVGRLVAIHFIHIGYANTQGIGDIAIKHYKEVNNLDYETVRKDYDEAFHVWEERSKFKWTLSEHEILKRVEELTGINCDLTNSVNGRFYANVPYYDKDNAKTFGAKWDPERKMWYFMSEEARKNWYDCEDH